MTVQAQLPSRNGGIIIATTSPGPGTPCQRPQLIGHTATAAGRSTSALPKN